MAHDSHGLITIPYKKGDIPAYQTCQNDGQPHPALILIHEVWGLTNHVKGIADRLCAEGYEVIAPDLIAGTELESLITPELQKALFIPEERAKRQVEIRAMMAPLGSPTFAATVTEKLEACFEYLKQEPDITKIGAIGFCFGGTYSFGLAAQQPGISASVPFYGHGEQYTKDFGNITCPVLAIYGATDEGVNQHIPEIEAKMKSAGKNFTSKIYPGVGHAFFNETNPVTYNKAIADQAWKLSLEFLNKNLK